MTLDIVTYLCNIRDMNIKEQIKAEHEKIKNLSDEVINTNLEHLRSDHIKINLKPRPCKIFRRDFNVCLPKNTTGRNNVPACWDCCSMSSVQLTS